MGPGRRDEPGLATVPAGSDDGEFGGPAGWPFGEMHDGRVVAGWKMDVLWRRGRRRSPSVATGLSRWTAGTDYTRPNRGARHSDRAGRSLTRDFHRNGAKRPLDSRQRR